MLKILYVDDEQGNIDYFVTVFRREYHVLSALSGEQGLEMLKAHPDVSMIFTDQRMPRMTGIEFLKRAMEIAADAMRILVTGYADMDTVIRAINQGHIYYYISKPWTYEEMKIIIERGMENLQLRKEHRELILQTERKEKEMVISELENLRRQVNPHFLFNCLNTLHALVSDNPEAKEFTKRLSNIYRSFLEHNNNNAIRLRDEINFCRDYFYLQHIRFGGTIKYDLRVNSDVFEMYLPNASLQLLIENAIKHNVITRDRNLEVSIYHEEGFLVVRNNYQPKKQEASIGIGQLNLKKRYAYLTDLEPAFYMKDGFYYAKIPLLEESF